MVPACGGENEAVSEEPSAPYIEPPADAEATRIPTSIPTVSLTVAASDIRALDAAPFADVDVPASFTDSSGTTYEAIDAHYRGAYALDSLIRSGAPQRNWKLKFAKNQRYRERREWNLTYQPDLRQKLAYDLMHLAGVRLPSARHVTLVLNGKVQGLYLEYEDPDDKQFLEDRFGDDTGDLYKAAQDIPGQRRYFATCEFLGDEDDDYFFHYNKKTNEDGANATDYGALRAFIRELRDVPSSRFTPWFEAEFDVAKLVSYLVVANFVSHWDGYPYRPKNFWLYRVPSAARWVFIPWDMDGTFQTETFPLNRMGTRASVFYQFDRTEPYGGHAEEGTERPLVRRAMQQPELRAAYVARYREALSSFLAVDSVLDRIRALEEPTVPSLTADDAKKFTAATEDMRAFVIAKHEAVTAELAREP